MGVAVGTDKASARLGESGTVRGPDVESVVVAEPDGPPVTIGEWSSVLVPGDDGRQSVRYWVTAEPNPDLPTDAHGAPKRRQVTLDEVGTALMVWMRATRTSQLGCTFNVTDPKAKTAMVDWFISGHSDAGGPVAAVLRSLGVDIVDRCYGCGKTTPLGAPVARSCGECGHVWATDADLVDHDFAAVSERYDPDVPDDEWGGGPPPQRRSPTEIRSCPCCGHNF